MKYMFLVFYFGLMALCFAIMGGAGTAFLFYSCALIGLFLCIYQVLKK